MENQKRNSDPNARVNIYQDDLTLNGNADPLAGGLALLQKKFSLLGLELNNKDKSTIWTNPNGLSHNSSIVERTGMKRADAPIIFHLNSNLHDDTTTLPPPPLCHWTLRDPFTMKPRKLNSTSFWTSDRLHQETHDPH